MKKPAQTPARRKSAAAKTSLKLRSRRAIQRGKQSKPEPSPKGSLLSQSELLKIKQLVEASSENSEVPLWASPKEFVTCAVRDLISSCEMPKRDVPVGSKRVQVTLDEHALAAINRMIAECNRDHTPASIQCRTPEEFIAQTAAQAARDGINGIDHERAARQMAELIYELRTDIMQNIFDVTNKPERQRLAMALKDCEAYRQKTGRRVDPGATPIDIFTHDILSETQGCVPATTGGI